MCNITLIIDKISSPRTHLNSDDLSPNQKKLLYEVMMRHGASQGFTYDRFFKEGFREWELMGIDEIKARFVEEHSGSFPIPYSEYEGLMSFYEYLGISRMKLAFIEYMGSLGMGANTVMTRFNASDDGFSDYERIGVRAVVDIFLDELKEKDIT